MICRLRHQGRFQGELLNWHAPSYIVPLRGCPMCPMSLSALKLLIISAMHISLDSPDFFYLTSYSRLHILTQI